MARPGFQVRRTPTLEWWGRVARLPILHTTRDHWQLTALFSNTARDHELGKTADWVIIFFTSDHTIENQCTVVTETMGQLKGKRVVRAREKECVEFFLNSVSG